MNSRMAKIFVLGLMLITAYSCKKDDLTQQQLLKQQQSAQLKQLKALTASDSLKYLLALSQAKYKMYVDSLARADSLAITHGTYLPYSYEIQVIDGSVSSVAPNGRLGSNGTGSTVKIQSFANPVTVTITQYGVKQTQSGTDGLFTFKNIGVGSINGTISCPGYADFNWVIDASLPFQLFQQTAASATGGTGGAGGGTGGTGSSFITNPFALKQLLGYFNNRSFSNSFPIFATSGPNTGIVTGRAYIETDLTNTTKEVVPTGTQITASVDVSSGTFKSNFIPTLANDPLPTNNAGSLSSTAILNSIFIPKSFSIGYLGTATTNATGDYTLTVAGSPQGIPVRIQFSDVIATKTYFVSTNGDVAKVQRRNEYGPDVSGNYTFIPFISQAPTVSFFAGGGASATATISGNGSVTALNLTSGGSGYLSTPRVIISPPPASSGGTTATATVSVTNGVVTAISLTNGGSGYTSSPSVTITEGSGGTASVSNFAYNSTTGGVANVSVTQPGGSYATAPNVIFWYDLNGNTILDAGEELNTTNFPSGVTQSGFQTAGTNFPTATAVLSGGGSVGSISMTNNGGGLQKAPNVTISSGQGATADITVTGGVITGIANIVGGRYYTSVPTVNLASLGGFTTQAVLTPTLTGGKVTGISITNAGAGYTNGTYVGVPIVAVGSGAAGSVVWQGVGISSVTVTPGTKFSDNIYYSTTPSIVFSAPQYGGPGSSTATGTAVLGTDGRLVGVNITNIGSGYDGVTPVAIQVISGSGAAAQSTFGNVKVSAVNITSGGNGYIVAPQVLILDASGAGSGATATATLTAGQVTSVNVTNGGSGYINGATVVFLDPGKKLQFTPPAAPFLVNDPAQANVFVTNGAVSSVSVWAGGSNYPAGTIVSFSTNGNPLGTGATGTATVTNGAITGVTVTAGGTAYVGNNYASAIGSIAGSNPNSLLNLSNPGTIQFSPTNTQAPGINLWYFPYTASAGVTRIVDVYYGTGQDKD